jgi:hypothetical protein
VYIVRTNKNAAPRVTCLIPALVGMVRAVSLSEKAKLLAQLIVETDDDFGPAYGAVTDELSMRPSQLALDQAASTIFEYAARTTDIEREINLYVVTGAMVESGGDAAIGWTHLLSRLRAGMARLAAAIEELAAQRVNLDQGASSPGLDPELRTWIASFRYWVMAVTARMSRRPDLRQQARSDDVLVRSVATVQQHCPSNHGYFLGELLDMFDGQLVVIDVPSQAVDVWQVEAIRNCAHLITMLDGANARGLADSGAVHTVEHHYTSFGSLDEVAEGLLRAKRLRSVDWMFMLGVDRRVGRIPALDLPGLGPVRIVVKAPKSLSRTFRPAQFFSPIHDDCVEHTTCARTLSGAERSSVVSRIVQAARQLRKELGRTEGKTSFPPELMQHPSWLAHWGDD